MTDGEDFQSHQTGEFPFANIIEEGRLNEFIDGRTTERGVELRFQQYGREELLGELLSIGRYGRTLGNGFEHGRCFQLVAVLNEEVIFLSIDDLFELIIVSVRFNRRSIADITLR